ncbi:hypothetical protein ABIA32_005014 [Streptacidiphilus sp. MAP12-20]|uniref:hypothetical protein n=1 Tax=Streptacidiphilus sp. MAP12-20 TaxID=3156299 RepID=UPI003516A4CF
MRVLMIAKMDTEKANQAIQSNRLPEFMQTNLGRLQPESAYFTAVEGVRTAFIVFDLKEPAQMPSIAEPFFQELGANVTFSPAMNVEDVTRGLGPDYAAA